MAVVLIKMKVEEGFQEKKTKSVEVELQGLLDTLKILS